MSYKNAESNSKVEFAQSGKFIPIDQNYALQYVFNLLNDYDKKKASGIDLSNQTNPYRDTLVMPVNNGKFIAVPEQLQQYAVGKWIESNGENNVNNTNANNVANAGSAGGKSRADNLDYNNNEIDPNDRRENTIRRGYKFDGSDLLDGKSINLANDNNKFFKHYKNFKNDDSDEDDDGIIVHASNCGCKKCETAHNNTDSYYYVKIFVCILFLIVLAYFVMSLNNGGLITNASNRPNEWYGPIGPIGLSGINESNYRKM